MSWKASQRGISQVEIIVVIAISIVVIGIVIATSWYLSQKNKDIATLSDIARITSALDITYAVNTNYPLYDSGVELGVQALGTQQLCLRGFTALTAQCDQVILRPLPQNEAGTMPFWYISTNQGADYGIEFELLTNHTTLGLLKGLNCAIPGGIQPGACIQE